MKEVINLIFSTWQSYWNGSGYPYLLVGTVLFILAGLFLRGQYGRKKYIKFGQNPEKDDRKSEIENSIVNKEQSEPCREDTDRSCTKAKAGAVAIYTLLALAAFFFPISAWILQKCIGAEVYWRVLWVVPVVPLLAYVGTRLVRMPKKRIAQAAVLVIMLGVTAV